MLHLEQHIISSELLPKLKIKGVSNFSALIFSILLVSSPLKADDSSYMYNPIHPLSPLNPIHHTTVESTTLSPEQQRQMVDYFGTLGLILLGTGLYYALSDFQKRK